MTDLHEQVSALIDEAYKRKASGKPTTPQERTQRIRNFNEWDARFLVRAELVKIRGNAVEWSDDSYEGVYSDVKSLVKAGTVRVAGDGTWEVHSS